ncbi:MULTISPECIES: histone-like nucleoid-structuring protein, MvaT/MvaU family [Pseudomonas]|uniref:histone-like nucleoid-structuring protein, MvaT/MvaU family n=1 Tax=Pseudomonas TaxID=286 RepID=UPI000F03F0DB|nr:DNA binding protein [Pseudomonas putida]MBD8681950.1 DNA binding protein [Pseudomonas sp. CFBP 13719]
MSASKVQQFHDLQKSIAQNKARLAEIQPQVQERLDMVELFTMEANEKGFNLEELVLAMCPHLDPAKQSAAAAPAIKTVKTRKARVVKTYLNPHTGEKIQTKGGNHKQLKEWKGQWGGDVVESWVQDQA